MLPEQKHEALQTQLSANTQADGPNGDMLEFGMRQQWTTSTVDCPNGRRPQQRTTQRQTPPMADDPNNRQPQRQIIPTAITHIFRIETGINIGNLFENNVVL